MSLRSTTFGFRIENKSYYFRPKNEWSLSEALLYIIQQSIILTILFLVQLLRYST